MNQNSYIIDYLKSKLLPLCFERTWDILAGSNDVHIPRAFATLAIPASLANTVVSTNNVVGSKAYCAVITTSSMSPFLLTEYTLQSSLLMTTTTTFANRLNASKVSVPPTVMTKSNNCTRVVASLVTTATTTTATTSNSYAGHPQW